MSPNLASAILSLFISLLNKETPLKYKSFLVVLIKFSSFLMSNDNYRRSYRKQGAIKQMIKLIKDVLVMFQYNQSQNINEYIDLIAYIMSFFANFVHDNRKNREYFILKGGVSLTGKFLDKQFPVFYTHSKLVTACCSIIANTAVTTDNKIMLWVQGVIQNMVQVVRDSIKEQKSMGIERAEYALMGLWKASIECEDVQEELMKQRFLEIALSIIQNHSKNINMIAFTLAIVRRLASNG